MESVFTQKEHIIARDIVTKGLTAAAKSLAFFIKSDTCLELGNDFSVSNTFSDENISKSEGVIYLLSTDLLGDLKGISYLLFSKVEVEIIMKSRYPNKVFDDAKYKRKLASLILEIDNIITAGVMIEFANAFNYRTYGSVPRLDIVTYTEAIEIIKKGTEKNEFIMGFNAELISKSTDIKADFIWSVDKAFIDGVKSIKN